jgi:hypothetical protein
MKERWRTFDNRRGGNMTRSRDGWEEAPSQGTLTATRSWKNQEQILF